MEHPIKKVAMSRRALEVIFEEELYFRLSDGTPIEGSVFLGETELLPVELLREDPDAYSTEFDAWQSDVWIPRQSERREEILALHANAKRYLELQQAAERRQVVPFVGSGMSASSGLPIWSEVVTPELCRRALADAARNRGGAPNLVLPTAIGSAIFLGGSEGLTSADFSSSLALLRNVAGAAGPGSP